MISIKKLKNVKRLVTHANCPDGIASALIVKDALPDVEVLFVKHGTEQHRMLEPLPGTLFCDFSPWLPTLTEPRGKIDLEDGRTAEITDAGVVALRESLLKGWVEAGAIVLDHHPTQRDVTMAFVEAGLGVYGENDRGECGAWLAYEHVWRVLKQDESTEATRMPVRMFAALAGVRDTWKKYDSRWQAACEQAETLMFWGFDAMVAKWGREALSLMLADVGEHSLGHHLFQKKLEHAHTALTEAHAFVTAKGTVVNVFQGVSATSDAAEVLEKAQKEKFGKAMTDIVAGFHYRVDAGQLQLAFSTRSHTGYDVGAFCKSRGGGGHSAAAGFTVQGMSPEVSMNPYAVFRLFLEEWEQGQ